MDLDQTQETQLKERAPNLREKPKQSKLPITSLVFGVISIFFILFAYITKLVDRTPSRRPSDYLRGPIPNFFFGIPTFFLELLIIVSFMILSIILGVMGYRKAKMDTSHKKQKTFAIGGIVLGIIGLVLFVAFVAFIILVFILRDVGGHG